MDGCRKKRENKKHLKTKRSRKQKWLQTKSTDRHKPTVNTEVSCFVAVSCGPKDWVGEGMLSIEQCDGAGVVWLSMN